MEGSELEQFFDKYIVDNSWRMEEEIKEEPINELDMPNQSAAPDATAAAARAWSDASISKGDCSQNAPAGAERPGASEPSEAGACSTASSAPANYLTLWPGTFLQIQNVVSNVKLGCQLDLNFIAQKAWNIEYKPKAHNVLMRIRKPRTTAWINKSGTINCMGAKSEVESRIAVRRYARKLQKLGFPVRFMDFKIATLTATGKFFPVDLRSLWSAHRDHCRYEPELNPWLYYTGIAGINVKIFATGGVSFVGAKTKVQAYRVFNSICSMLSRFRRM